MNDLLLWAETYESSAVISDDKQYRYRLARVWGDGPRMLFVMLNPSKANALEDDPTIRRCIGFAKRESCGSLEVVNLFAYRSTDPDELLHCPVDAVGPENYQHVKEAAEQAGIIVAAWGAHGCATRLAVNTIRHAVRQSMMCLGTTKSGAPRHPLYLRADAPLAPWISGGAS